MLSLKLLMDVKFNVSKDVNFYFYLINLYSYDLDEVNMVFRSNHTTLRSKSFFKIFENLENPFIKDYLDVNKIRKSDLNAIQLERDKFNKLWPIFESSANSLKIKLKFLLPKIINRLEKAINLIKVIPEFETYFVEIVPFLGPHGKQDTHNFIYLSEKKDLSDEEYVFIVVHEILHLILYNFIMDYYFKYNYTSEIKAIEEILINFIYFDVVKEDVTNSLPRWPYLPNDEDLLIFNKLENIKGLIFDGISLFVDKAIDIIVD